MKFIFVSTFTFFLFIGGCASPKNSADDKMDIVSAKYNEWSKPPLQESDVPEKGVDLTVTAKNWSKKAKAEYLIYQNKKSYEARVADSTDQGTVIKARIITSSSVMDDESESVDLTDRLVFTGPDGETSFIEIEQWERE